MMISRQRERISSNLTCLIREQRSKKMGSGGSGGSVRERLLGIGGSSPAACDSCIELIEEDVWGVGEESQQWEDHLRRQESNQVFRAWLLSNWDANYPSPSNSSRRSALEHASPINVPDWAKILRQKRKTSNLELDFDEDVENDEWIPPHEIADRIHSSMIAFSVLEGAGRTLKGRDLRRVRNAVWAQTGLID